MTYLAPDGTEFQKVSVHFHSNAAKRFFVKENGFSPAEIESETPSSFVFSQLVHSPLNLDANGWVYSWRNCE